MTNEIGPFTSAGIALLYGPDTLDRLVEAADGTQSAAIATALADDMSTADYAIAVSQLVSGHYYADLPGGADLDAHGYVARLYAARDDEPTLPDLAQPLEQQVLGRVVEAALDTLDARLTADRAAKLDRDLAEKADVQAAAPAGDGDTAVNHDTGGSDNLRFVDPQGNGIDNASIRAYLKSEYDADPTSATLRAGPIYTGADGRWVGVMMLNAGLTYTIVYSRPGYNAATAEVTP